MAGLFSVAGTSRLNGVVKVRFANNIYQRTKILERGEHTEINLMEFKGRFTKLQLCEFLINHPSFQDEESQSAIFRYVAQNAKDSYDTFRGIAAPKEAVLA